MALQIFYNCGRVISNAFVNGVFSVVNSTNLRLQRASTEYSSDLNGFQNRSLKLQTAVSGFSKSNGLNRVKPGKFGDDAYFVSRHPFGDFIGVADGVGGWRSWGIDPGEFSQRLMEACERLLFSSSWTQAKTSSNTLSPASLLADAYEELQRSRGQVLGSSTACIIMVRNQMTHTEEAAPMTSHLGRGILSSANIGDSGYLVVRAGRVLYRSHEQQHYFNTPFQLSIPPSEARGQVLSDNPRSADVNELEVKVGDLLLVATDGVFDNLTLDFILTQLQTINPSRPSPLVSLQKVANVIAEAAKSFAFDESYMSPFAKNAIENGIANTKGGKPDDITVVLAQIST